MMAKQMTVNGKRFPTKKALIEHIRSIVSKYPDETPLDYFDRQFIIALLENHPQRDTKIGAGISHIVIRTNPIYRNNRGFHLFRIDGSDTDVSWTECLNPTPHHKKVISAMRVLIEPQTIEFKNNFFARCVSHEAVCPITGEKMEFTNCHVDHVAPLTFEKLVGDFCDERNLNLNSVKLRDELADNKYVDVIDDDALADAWQAYHEQHARLRVISAFANLSIAKTGYPEDGQDDDK